MPFHGAGEREDHAAAVRLGELQVVYDPDEGHLCGQAAHEVHHHRMERLGAQRLLVRRLRLVPDDGCKARDEGRRDLEVRLQGGLQTVPLEEGLEATFRWYAERY